MNNLIWIGPALFFGLLAMRFGLPPMVGYLIGGFILNVSGVYDAAYLSKLGDLGVTLLLFTIGLKLDVKSLLKPVIWAGSVIHLVAVVVIFGAAIFGLSLLGLAVFAGVDPGDAVLIAFALSFSSTVFAVKILEERGEMSSRHGRIAIGILIMQDIFAVLFLAVSSGTMPTMWALGLLGLIPLRRLLLHVMGRVGHGEMAILYGLALTFGAYGLFKAVGIKGDLGALIIGAMMAGHPMASEMSKKLMGFKDLLLVGFFLSIGMAGEISVAAVLVAAGLAVAVVVKVLLYFAVFSGFRLRARTSTLASLNLANFSEFGLIVGSIAVANGWLSGDWLVIIALALTMTFVIAAPLNARAGAVLAVLLPRLRRFESSRVLPEDGPIDTGGARIAIVGMTRGGAGAYDALRERFGDILIGLDASPEIVARHSEAGRRVMLADVTDDDFWARAGNKPEVLLLAMPEHEENLALIRRFRACGEEGCCCYAMADHPEEEEAMKRAGADMVWNMGAEAGRGFAEDVIRELGDSFAGVRG